MSKKKVTIYDVAKLANVSTSTVSRYINRTSFISKEKVDLIERSMFELGFKPKNRDAQPLTKRTMKIGLVSPAMGTDFVHRIVGGMQNTKFSNTYEVLMEYTDWQNKHERLKLEELTLKQVDGIVIIGGKLEEQKILDIVGQTPTLLLCRQSEGVLPSISLNNEIGGYLATNHLIQLGHSHIAHVAGPLLNHDAQQRKEGYLRAMKNAGLSVKEEMIIDGEFDPNISLHNLQRAIEAGIRPTAIFAANDYSAFGVIQGLNQLGYKVPEEVSVVGYDDLSLANFYIPRLTTVKQPFVEIGQLAIQVLLDIISGNKTDYTIPTSEIVVRDSTCLQAGSTN
ncbi:LacI family DNA-binding transcriptional regulator [Vibrio sp. WXL103]|uniref:LacI family DNA-binding transcriptional regulator n=1 Tax=Vibrio sp. WXL103 TaxID=3450710 RepID=UPI003EC846AD